MRATRLQRVRLEGVVTPEDLAKSLLRAGQEEWCTRVRLSGLLLLIDYALRNRASNGVLISAHLARVFSSRLRRQVARTTIREPLSVLCDIGILRQVQAAVHGLHLRTAARYAFCGAYTKRHVTLDVDLPFCLLKKRELASSRRKKRRNRYYPFLSQLEEDLKKISFGPESRQLVTELSCHPKLAHSVRRVVEALGGVDREIRISPRGQITTVVTSCPRELKPFLLIEGEATVSCDIAFAHHCFLPVLLKGRIDYLRKEQPTPALKCYESERERLITFLSNGDYYSKWCIDPTDESERQKKKLLINVLLNSSNAKCEGNGLYRYMRTTFPLTFSVCEDLKRKDHRNLSKQLHSYTATAINGALLDTQAQGIAAIPDVDAIICPSGHKETVVQNDRRASVSVIPRSTLQGRRDSVSASQHRVRSGNFGSATLVETELQPV